MLTPASISVFEIVLETVEEVGCERQCEFVLRGFDNVFEIAQDGRARFDQRDGFGVPRWRGVTLFEVRYHVVERRLHVGEGFLGVDGDDLHRSGFTKFD